MKTNNYPETTNIDLFMMITKIIDMLDAKYPNMPDIYFKLRVTGNGYFGYDTEDGNTEILIFFTSLSELSLILDNYKLFKSS